MTPHMKLAIAGVAVSLVLLVFGIPFWLIGRACRPRHRHPRRAWLMLDESQRRRYRELRQHQQRGQLR